MCPLRSSSSTLCIVILIGFQCLGTIASGRDDFSALTKPASWTARELLAVEEKEPEKKDESLKNDPKAPVKIEDMGVTTAKGEKDSTGFVHGFIASLSVIIVSELGDKTFFIAAIMAMKHSRVTVLIGALGALFVMTILSALVGYATTVIPRTLTFYASSALFALFGLKMLREGWYMSPDEGQDEYEEVQADLKKREDETTYGDVQLTDMELAKQKGGTQDVETGIIRTPGRHLLSGILSTIFLQALTLTFLAEWGDRSQIATIMLAAREEVFGVIVGGCLGHTLCTGLAVLGGRFIAQRISVRTVTLVGGVVFILFAFTAFFVNPES